MPIKTMPIKMIVLSLVVLIAIAGAVAAVPLGGRSGDENNSVLDQDYDDRWVADFPETIGGFNVGYVTTPKDRACSSVPVIYLQSPRASLEEYLSNPPDISLLKAAIHSESGVPSQVTLSFSSRLISKETAAAKNVAWNQDRTDNGCRGPRTDIDDEELSGPSRGFANFKNTDAGRWTNANAQGVKITSPSGIGTAQNVWSSALNNVMTNDNYFLQVGLDFDEARLDLIWTEDEEDLDPQYFTNVPYLANTRYQFSITYTSGAWQMCAGNDEDISQYECIISGDATGTYLKLDDNTSVFFENANSNTNWHSGFPATVALSSAKIYRNGIGQAWSGEDRKTGHQCHPDSYPVDDAMSGSLVNNGSATWVMSGIPLAC